MTHSGPDIAEIRAFRDYLRGVALETPVLRCPALEEAADSGATAIAKLEFLQHTGTFKARGALASLRALTPEQRRAGVTAVSAGNHAIATAYAARAFDTTAKVVMIASANPERIRLCKSFGAEVVLAKDVHEAFTIAEQIQSDEGRVFVHPFEGESVALGTGTLGLEICEQVDHFDTLLVPIGGGGLAGGVANAVKQLRPDCEIIGIEPVGADSMHRSREAGEPRGIDAVKTIADSLGAPFALPYSFALCEQHIDRLVRVDDEALRRCMGLLFHRMKIAVEPACAASTAAFLGPLRDELAGKRVVLVMCGSNIDWRTFSQQAYLT